VAGTKRKRVEEEEEDGAVDRGVKESLLFFFRSRGENMFGVLGLDIAVASTRESVSDGSRSVNRMIRARGGDYSRYYSRFNAPNTSSSLQRHPRSQRNVRSHVIQKLLRVQSRCAAASVRGMGRSRYKRIHCRCRFYRR
jgi:hypothetical protein